jgi:hypothetical protein
MNAPPSHFVKLYAILLFQAEFFAVIHFTLWRLIKIYKCLFLISFINNATYKISVNFTKNLLSTDTIVLSFNTQLISQLNSLLETVLLSKNLYTENIDSVEKQLKAAQSSATTLLITVTSVVLGTSLMTMDSNSIINFLTKTEIFSQSTLYYMPQDPTYTAYFNNLQLDSVISNPFDPLSPNNTNSSNQSVIISESSNEYLILKSSGLKLSLLGIIIVSLLITYLISLINITCIAKYIEKLIKMFKFDIFLKYFIFAHYELLMHSFYEILNKKAKSSIEIINQIISYGCIVINI